jgi:hypothetical protein
MSRSRLTIQDRMTATHLMHRVSGSSRSGGHYLSTAATT